MSYFKRIVCLANSYKPRGCCIAGREVSSRGEYGEWIRPVSARPTAELQRAECRYRDGAAPMLMDIMDVPLLDPIPGRSQTENYLVAACRWEKRGRLPWEEMEKLCDQPESLWTNSDHTGHGQNDCMSSREAAAAGRSLLLIRLKDLVMQVHFRLWDGIRSRFYRANFDYKGTHYNLSLTDPAAINRLQANPEGDYPIRDVYLCLSLTEPYKEDGRCHKLVAGVIGKPPLQA